MSGAGGTGIPPDSAGLPLAAARRGCCWLVTSQLNSISASMVTIRTVNVLGCFLLSELKLIREAMAPAMARGSGPGPSRPDACALGLLTSLEEPHRPQGHHGGRPAGPGAV